MKRWEKRSREFLHHSHKPPSEGEKGAKGARKKKGSELKITISSYSCPKKRGAGKGGKSKVTDIRAA